MIYVFLLNIIENEKRKVERKKNIKIAKNIATGLTIGATLGILFAPKSGEDTREDIKDKSKVLSNDIKDGIDNKKKNIEGLKNTFSNIKRDIKERAKKESACSEVIDEEYIDIDIILENEDNLESLSLE